MGSAKLLSSDPGLGMAMPRDASRRSTAAPLPWPAAALTIAALSAGLWLGLGWVVVTLL